MNQKTDVEVVINNKKYVICGYESTEYLERIASYINKKVAVLKSEEWYRNLEPDMKNVLLDINLADDFFKAKDHIKELQDTQSETDDDIIAIKHEIIDKQNEIERLEHAYKELEERYQEAQTTITKLKIELDVTRQ